MLEHSAATLWLQKLLVTTLFISGKSSRARFMSAMPSSLGRTSSVTKSAGLFSRSSPSAVWPSGAVPASSKPPSSLSFAEIRLSSSSFVSAIRTLSLVSIIQPPLITITGRIFTVYSSNTV